MSEPTDYSERERLEELLAMSAAAFAKYGLSGFRAASLRAFQAFDGLFCKGVVTLRVEVDLLPSGEARAMRIVAISKDGRRTELG